MNDNLIFNGVNGLTGGYLTEPMTLERIAHWATSTVIPPVVRQEMDARQLFGFPIKHGVDGNDLAQSGWAIVFPRAPHGSREATRQAAIRAALQPLLDHRRRMATRRDPRLYREIHGDDGWAADESKRAFLSRMGAAASGPVDPEKFPYFVLLCGSPTDITFRQQYELDVQYGVGRIHFHDLADYAAYARNVVAAEVELLDKIPTAAFFAVENVDDPATYASRHMLTEPLVAGVRTSLETSNRWRVQQFMADAATKEQLASLLGACAPSLLFTASHGVGFPSGSRQQRACQGAILCQDWPGEDAGCLSEKHYFTGADIGADADLSGLISFHFACYGLGTPRFDEFARHRTGRQKPTEIAPQPFVAELPRRMLGRERGALACIGHVDRAWSSSFVQYAPAGQSGVDTHIHTFLSSVQRLLTGDRVGLAMDDFNLRFAELASELATVLDDIQTYGQPVHVGELAHLWLYMRDARNYAVLGDPAVRIATTAEQLAAPRPASSNPTCPAQEVQ